MPFQPGHKLSAGGREDKAFGDALRIEIAAAGADQRVLRVIARNLLFLAQQPEMAALPAIRELADRLDGKPKQEAERSHCARRLRANSATMTWPQSHSVPVMKKSKQIRSRIRRS